MGEFWQASLTDWHNNLNSIVRFTNLDHSPIDSAQESIIQGIRGPSARHQNDWFFLKPAFIVPFMSRKILFVDDEEDLRSMAGEYLKFMGHEFWPAANAGEALRIAAEIPLDVIILDLNLGGESGGSSLLSRRSTGSSSSCSPSRT